jgi:cytochrome c oxidase cbb3-type subunit 3
MSDRNQNHDEPQDQLREHTFDGIQEFDNKLPNWWLWILYGSIVFALAYWLVLHTVKAGDLPHQALEKEMAAAAEAQLARMAEGGLSNETFEVMLGVPARMQEGQEIFNQYCAVCHLENGSGSVGPNLTDPYWIHGPTAMDHYEVIMNGVPAKGMAAWANQLGPKRVEAVTAYVLSLHGKNVPGKDPEGEYYGEGEPASE